MRPGSFAGGSDSGAPKGSGETVVDVTGASAPFGFIKMANVFILVMAVNMAIAMAVLAVKGQTTLSDVPVQVALVAVFAFAGVIAFRNISVLHAVVQPFTQLSLLLMTLASAFVAFSAFVTTDFANFNPENPDHLGATAGILGMGMVFVLSIAAMIAVAFARGAKPKGLALTNTALMRTLERASTEDKARPVRAPAKHPVRAWAWIGAGLAWLAGVQLIPDSIYYNTDYYRVLNQITPLGFLFFVLARRDFQPDAQKLLKSDTRAPIVYLRSFQDDEKLSHNRAEFAVVDWSLETRLSAHFSRLGPFVAIGNPKEKTLEIGAARALLSDDEWQARVADWMARAQIIVLMTGVTHWVGWELKKAIDSGYADKLIILFPQSRKMFSFKKESVARLKTIQDAVAGTIWQESANALQHPERLRALVLESDGAIARFKARSRSRNAYHLAALAAHHHLLSR